MEATDVIHCIEKQANLQVSINNIGHTTVYYIHFGNIHLLEPRFSCYHSLFYRNFDFFVLCSACPQTPFESDFFVLLYY